MIEIVGWAGSVLLVVSLLQSGMMRLRLLNLIAAIVLVGYNAAVETWPMVGMNAAVAIIDIWYIIRLRADAKSINAVEPVSTSAQ
jgi:hypothetical protein